MLPFKLVYSDAYFLPIGQHVFPAEKYRLVAHCLQEQGLATGDDFLLGSHTLITSATFTGLLSPNVDLSQTMVALIDAQRSYEMDSRAIQNQDQMMQVANQIRQ